MEHKSPVSAHAPAFTSARVAVSTYARTCYCVCASAIGRRLHVEALPPTFLHLHACYIRANMLCPHKQHIRAFLKATSNTLMSSREEHNHFVWPFFIWLSKNFNLAQHVCLLVQQRRFCQHFFYAHCFVEQAIYLLYCINGESKPAWNHNDLYTRHFLSKCVV